MKVVRQLVHRGLLQGPAGGDRLQDVLVTCHDAHGMIGLVEHLHVFFIHFRREGADHGNALETISSEHIAGLQGELLGFSVEAGGKISLIRSQSAGESRLQPLSRFPLHALERGLRVGDDLAGNERQVAA